MHIKFPVRLEDGTIIKIGDPPFELKDGQRLNGYDADGNRITNITGFDGQYLLKWCPHCEGVYLSIDFGPSGRPSADGRRDQSWCQICRSR